MKPRHSGESRNPAASMHDPGTGSRPSPGRRIDQSISKAFVDSNVALYLLSADHAKADRAERLIAGGVIISVQVLNEIASVSRRKLGMSWAQANEVLTSLQSLCRVEPLTIATHERGRRVAERYGLSVYDAMIVASALLADCVILYSEDMHDGLFVDRQLRIRNPFRAGVRTKGP